MFKIGLPPYFRNKYVLSGVVFVVYTLFLDNLDIFTIFNQHIKLNRLEESCEDISRRLDSTKTLYRELKKSSALENFAREKKFFKKENEDIFVISYE